MKKVNVGKENGLIMFLVALVLIFAALSIYQLVSYTLPSQSSTTKVEKIIEKQVYVESSAGISAVKTFSSSVLNVIIADNLLNYTSPIADRKRLCFDDMNNCNELALMLTSDGIVIYSGKYQEMSLSDLLLVDSTGETFQIESIGKYRGFSIWKLMEKGELPLSKDSRTKFYSVKPVLLGDLRVLQVGQRALTLVAALPGYQEIQEGSIVAKISAKDSVVMLDDKIKSAEVKISESLSFDKGFLFNLNGQLLSMKSVNGQIIASDEIASLLVRMNDSTEGNGLEMVDMGFKCLPLNRELSQEMDLEVDYGCLVIGGFDLGSDPLNNPTVEKGSVAEIAGIRYKDIILEVDNRSLLNNDIIETIMTRVPGKKIDFTVLRGGKTKDLFVEL
jgi:hypothetical protein